MTRPLAAVALLALAPVAAAQRPPAPTVPAAGYGLFRELFALEGIGPLATRDEAAADPARTIVVYLGYPENFPRPARLAREVLSAGGAVLYAGDTGADVGPLFPAPTGLLVTGERVVPKGEPDAPPSPTFLAPGLTHPAWELTLGTIGLVTDRPSFLTVGRPSKYVETVIARFPRTTRVGGPNGERLPDEHAFILAGAGTGDDKPFRSLVVADPDVFANRMLVRDDRQNLLFALKVVRWLRGTGDARRTHCLFVENGHIQPRFDEHGFGSLVNPPPPVPPLPDPLDPKLQAAITEAADTAITKAEDADLFNRLIVGREGERFPAVLRVLAGLAAVGLVVWLLTRTRAARHAPDVPPPPRELAADAQPAGAVAARRAELMRTGNLTEPVRDYLRGLFAARGLPVVTPGGPMPPVEADGPGARRLTRDLRAVWDAVFGPKARPVTRETWKELEPMVDEIRRAAEAGRFRFAPGDPA